MEIKQQQKGTQLKVTLKGFLDTMTSPQLEKELDLKGIQDLIIDMKGIEYVSSAGLRTLLSFHKTLNSQKGKMTLLHLTKEVKEIFSMVGFMDILNIK